MTKAENPNKNLVVSILIDSFMDNASVNYITKQDSKRIQKTRKLMEYSYDICNLFGKVHLTDDKKACALIILPDKKRTTLKSIIADIKLIAGSTGLFNVKKAMHREAAIKKIHSQQPFTYLWFIGVSPSEQNKGRGTVLLEKILEKSKAEGRPVILETSTERNLP
jgi:GNAT superfamily N-acetyltransferase